MAELRRKTSRGWFVNTEDKPNHRKSVKGFHVNNIEVHAPLSAADGNAVSERDIKRRGKYSKLKNES